MGSRNFPVFKIQKIKKYKPKKNKNYDLGNFSMYLNPTKKVQRMLDQVRNFKLKFKIAYAFYLKD